MTCSILLADRLNMKGKQLRSMYIYIPRLVSFTENAVYWKFLFILYFLLSFYIYQFLCVSICLVAVEKHVYIYLAWFLLLKMPYTGNFFLYNFFFTFFLYLSFLCISICLVWEFLFLLNFLLSFYIYHFYV